MCTTVIVVSNSPEGQVVTELLVVSQRDEKPAYFSQLNGEDTADLKQVKAWLRSRNVGVVVVDMEAQTERYVADLVPFVRKNLKNHFVALWVVAESGAAFSDVDRIVEPALFFQPDLQNDIERELRKQRAISKALGQQKGYLKLLAKINKFNRSNVSPNQVLAEFVNELNAFCGARQTYVLRQSKDPDDTLMAYKALPEGKLQRSELAAEVTTLWQSYLTLTKPDIKFAEQEAQPHALVFPVWVLDKHSCTVICQVDQAEAAKFTFSKIKVLEEAAAQLKIILENMESQRRMKQHYQRLKSSLAELSMAKEQLVHSEKMASLGRLTAGIAHEINNPLGIALGNFTPLSDYAEAMMKLIAMHDEFIGNLAASGQADVPDQIADYKKEKDVSFILEDLSSVIADSRASLLRVKSIVSDLSSLSQGVQSERETCKLKLICDEVIKLHFYENERQPRIDNLVPEDVVIHTNPALLTQALGNLHANALEALQGGDEEAVITYRCDGEPGRVILTVADTGVGIAPDDLHRVLDPFFTTKPLGDGRGMGLTVAFNVIHGLGGELTLASQVGEGTQVMLSLPTDHT